MPQLDFILNHTDQEVLMDYALSLGCYYVPLKLYNTDSYDVYKNADYYQNIKNESLICILNDLYSISPLIMGSFDKDDQLVYYIKPRYGGPTIDYLSSNIIDDKDVRIGRGAISFYPSYYSDERELIPSDYLKDVYGKLIKHIKKWCKI
jgi:hypothetical protein